MWYSMLESQNQFKENYHGILTHNGEIKVSKGDVEQQIDRLRFVWCKLIRNYNYIIIPYITAARYIIIVTI